VTETTTMTRPLAEPAARGAVRAGRVLLAEDDSEMRRLLADALRGESYDVVEAADGTELLDQLSVSLVRQLPLDCIITDVYMPRMTGTEALQRIRGAGLDCPVIVITAFGSHTTRVDAWLLGASAVLDKPFTIPELMDELRRIGPNGAKSWPEP